MSIDSGEREIVEPQRTTPVGGSWDVVVCGGGPSGFIAAIAAARQGARTLLIENLGFLGGMATAALVGPMSKFNLNGQRVVGGIPEEFISRLADEGGAVVDLPSGNVPFDAEVYKVVAQRMVRESGATILYHSRVCDLIESDEPGRFSHVVVEGPSGRVAYEARFIIDCTGTGDAVARTTLPSALRLDGDGGLQPLSLVFVLGGVDTERLGVWMAEDGVKYANQELRALLQDAVDRGELAAFGGPWAVFGSTIREGQVSVNATRFAGNAADAADRTAGELRMRDDVTTMVQIFREGSEAFANSYLMYTAPQAGIRETRAIDGQYTMTMDDVLSPKRFEDSVAMGAHFIDIHHTDTKQTSVFVGQPYGIPFRALVPKGSQNLIVAGGSISATKEAFASVRVQAQCMALGHAAGVAAAMCSASDAGVGSLDYGALRSALVSQGAIVE